MMYWGGFFLQNQQRQDILNKRQEVYGTARYVAERMLLLTNGLHSLFRRYIRTTKTGKVDILDFRALDPCVFQCCVAIKRPIRPQTFMVKMTFSCYISVLILIPKFNHQQSQTINYEFNYSLRRT